MPAMERVTKEFRLIAKKILNLEKMTNKKSLLKDKNEVKSKDKDPLEVDRN